MVGFRAQHTLELDESDRQLVLMALANLSLAAPGFDMALNLIAKNIDNVTAEGRAELYDALRRYRSDAPLKGLEVSDPLPGILRHAVKKHGLEVVRELLEREAPAPRPRPGDGVEREP